MTAPQDQVAIQRVATNALDRAVQEILVAVSGLNQLPDAKLDGHGLLYNIGELQELAQRTASISAWLHRRASQMELEERKL